MYRNCCQLWPTITHEISWLQGVKTTVQQDGATLTQATAPPGNWTRKVDTTCLSVYVCMGSAMGNATSAGARSQRQRLGLFVWGKFRARREELYVLYKIVAGKKLFDEYDKGTLESAWRSLIRRDYLVVGVLGWNDFESNTKALRSVKEGALARQSRQRSTGFRNRRGLVLCNNTERKG